MGEESNDLMHGFFLPPLRLGTATGAKTRGASLARAKEQTEVVMKLLMTGLVIVMFADNLARQGQSTRQPRDRFRSPRLGRRSLYDSVHRKFPLKLRLLLPLSREEIERRRRP